MNIKKIDVALNKCYRTASGLLTPTPKDALVVEAQYKDFESLLLNSSLNLAAKSITTPSHALHVTFWYHINAYKRIIKSNTYASSIQHILIHLTNINSPIPNKPTNNIPTSTNITIDTTISSHDKNNTCPDFFKKKFLEYKSKIPVETTYFTDGSFLNGTAPYAVIEQQANGYSYMKVRQSLLTPHAGIFNAELAAIKFAVRHASSKKKHALICSDSLSVVKSLQHDGESRRFLLDGVTLNSRITILWIPAHVGIVGNELADEAAKEAIKMPLIMEVPCLSAIIKNFHKVEAANIKNTVWQTSSTFFKNTQRTT
ncbi:PREDICTED: uncharacterized protein LOC108359140 isoform X2 [Rhagoletis zephyria]|uniref:uncharacterized protein LOC108359140 isoform X2 n=1 Tax=Rhagoletis zephyria TaxID=28612 RepID=UPI0008114901|nr:PREDICTED: uncharacterized protein LOC108359140 isoform X2 [Rhagoletis zephyria]